jgi:hypothetical protein
MKDDMTSSLARGRIYVLMAIIVTLAGDACVTGLKIASKGIGPSLPGVIRWGITLALLLAVWRGRPWARWLTVVLMSIALLATIPTLLATQHPLIVGIFVQFLVTVVLLALPPSTSRFLAAQQGKQ